jgi:hypothetical protein
MRTTTDIKEQEEHYRQRLVKGAVPFHLHGGLILYFVDHVKPGRFLTAALQNNLSDTMVMADMESRIGLYHLVAFLVNEAPIESWGSPAKVERWLAAGSGS